MVPHLDERHVSIQSRTHRQPLPTRPGPDLAAQRPVSLIRIAGRQNATWQHQHEEELVPVYTLTAA
ncbi:hypothetical protein EPI10_007435 [Gossypium australe]|uniref:Uncharacterized protein n=1 Tax=Gossypium australe TaxID=47621 RepID=A0A5B6WVT6_9ROSI|nr:hypothetical protein EPI10_007435 [Gossypium australe]